MEVVDSDVPVHGDVRVKDLGQKPDFRWREGVVERDLEIEIEDPSFVRASHGPSDRGLPMVNAGI